MRFERSWFAQVRASLAVGIERPVIDAINARKTPDLADARERTCFVVARELLANKGLSDQTYAAAEKTMAILLSPTTHRQEPAAHWNATNVGGRPGQFGPDAGDRAIVRLRRARE